MARVITPSRQPPFATPQPRHNGVTPPTCGAALGLATKPPSRTGRALRAACCSNGGTTLKLGVGPVNLEAKFHRLCNTKSGGPPLARVKAVRLLAKEQGDRGRLRRLV